MRGWDLVVGTQWSRHNVDLREWKVWRWRRRRENGVHRCVAASMIWKSARAWHSLAHVTRCICRMLWGNGPVCPVWPAVCHWDKNLGCSSASGALSAWTGRVYTFTPLTCAHSVRWREKWRPLAGTFKPNDVPLVGLNSYSIGHWLNAISDWCKANHSYILEY